MNLLHITKDAWFDVVNSKMLICTSKVLGRSTSLGLLLKCSFCDFDQLPFLIPIVHYDQINRIISFNL